jgi:hypothetical protein
MKTAHSHFQRGATVRVVLRDGSVFVDKFVERTGKFLVFRERGRMRLTEIKTVGYRQLKGETQ